MTNPRELVVYWWQLAKENLSQAVAAQRGYEFIGKCVFSVIMFFSPPLLVSVNSWLAANPTAAIAPLGLWLLYLLLSAPLEREKKHREEIARLTEECDQLRTKPVTANNAPASLKLVRQILAKLAADGRAMENQSSRNWFVWHKSTERFVSQALTEIHNQRYQGIVVNPNHANPEKRRLCDRSAWLGELAGKIADDDIRYGCVETDLAEWIPLRN